MHNPYLVSAVTIYFYEFSVARQCPSALPHLRSALGNDSNEGGYLVFKYSAIRASSNGQESPTRIHCRYDLLLSPMWKLHFYFLDYYAPDALVDPFLRVLILVADRAKRNQDAT